MTATDEAVSNLYEVMAARYGAGHEVQEALRDMVAKVREAHERRMRDAQAAELLPLGPDACVERLGVARRTVYYMAERHRKRVQASR